MKITLLTTPNFKDSVSVRRILELRGWSLVKKNPKYVLAIGGDGSVLYAESKFPGTPIIALNCGKLGFLSCGEVEMIEEILKAVENGKISIENRNKLEFSVGKRKGACLNDIVVTESEPGRSLRITIKVDKHNIGTFVCDGVVFSTTTGSTGYNLSSGGPIMEPGIEAYSMTLLNPHLARFKSIVLPLSRKVELSFERAIPAPAIVVDGQKPIRISHKQTVKIKKHGKNAKLVKYKKDYYSRLESIIT